MAAIVEDNAFSFEHQPLKVRFLNDDTTRRDCASRIDDSMPGYVAFIARRCVHRPANKSGAVPFLKQARDLAVSHDSSARNAQHKAINLLKHLVVYSDRATRRRSGTSRFLRAAFRSSAWPLVFVQRLSHRSRPGAQASLPVCIDRLTENRQARMPVLPGNVKDQWSILVIIDPELRRATENCTGHRLSPARCQIARLVRMIDSTFQADAVSRHGFGASELTRPGEG